MKILKFKRKMLLKDKIFIVIGATLAVLVLTLILIYILNEPAREWINVHILRKSITEDDVATINLEVDKNQYIFSHSRFVSVLCNGKLMIYNSYASKEAEFDIGISNPIYSTNGNYLAIAETNGQKVYFISDTKILWDTKVEGDISKINVSKSGYVSIITTRRNYKSVIAIFDRNGKKLFEAYRASTIAIDTDISVDGKYLAIAEIKTSGTMIESNIEIIDMEKAINGSSSDSTVFIHKADANKMLTDIKYQEKGQLICRYDDSIEMIYEDKNTELIKFDSNTHIADINLKSCAIRTEEISMGPFTSKTNVILKNIISGVETAYAINSSVKEIVCYDQISAVNLGTEIHFINLNGWLEKKYTSNQEAKNIVLGTSVAGIIYRDRIKVLTF